jgi:hypothetical protein
MGHRVAPERAQVRVMAVCRVDQNQRRISIFLWFVLLSERPMPFHLRTTHNYCVSLMLRSESKFVHASRSSRPLHDSTQSHGSDSTHRLCESSRLNSSAL